MPILRGNAPALATSYSEYSHLSFSLLLLLYGLEMDTVKSKLLTSVLIYVVTHITPDSNSKRVVVPLQTQRALQ